MRMLDSAILTKLYKYCAYQDRCAFEIRGKLRDWAVAPELWDSYLVHLAAERFWDEARYTQSFVRGKFAYKQWGRQKIRHALAAKMVDQALIEAALQSEISAEDYAETLHRLATRKWKEIPGDLSYEKRAKLYRYLTQKGYEGAEISQAIQRVIPEVDR